MSFQQYVKRTSSTTLIKQLTILNSPAQARSQAGHQPEFFTPYYYPITGFTVTAVAPPMFPNRPGPSILTDGRSEGSLAIDNYVRRWTGKDICSRYQSRRMSSGQYHAYDRCTDEWTMRT